MKKLRYAILLSLPLFTLAFCTSYSSVKDKEQPNKKNTNTVSFHNNSVSKNFAVLELFTSQGCSSCPPADRLLATYISKENIIPLSFHVDYWDKLGWKDPYSSKEFTKRQYEYASALHSSVYTPQLVVNGQTEMIGSDANKLSSTIKNILAQNTGATISFKTLKAENNKASLSFNAEGTTSNCKLNIALVEKNTTTKINAGENGGATLIDNNVVRNFTTIGNINEGENTVAIDIPNSLNLNNAIVVIYLQQKDTGKIVAAAQASF